MPPRLLAAAFALSLGAAAGPVLAQTPGLAFDAPEAATAGTLSVTSAAIRAGGLIPQEFSGYGRNIAPPVAWSGAPTGTKTFVLVVQDTDSPGPPMTLHWLAWNIPGDLGALQRKTLNEPRLDSPKGMIQGGNSHGGIGWTGPHPPIGDPPHHYHFQVFALDAKLKAGPQADLPQVLAAMKGHVTAKGQVVGLYGQAPAPPPKG